MLMDYYLPVGIPIASHKTPGSFHNVLGTWTWACATVNESNPLTAVNTADAGTFSKLGIALHPCEWKEFVGVKIQYSSIP